MRTWSDAERGALVHDLLEQPHLHDTLPAVHLVARTEHALGVAEVGARSGRCRAGGSRGRGPWQPSGGGRAERWPEHPLGCGSDADSNATDFDYRIDPEKRIYSCYRPRFLHCLGVFDNPLQDFVEVHGRPVADVFADLGDRARLGMSSKPAS